MTQVSRYRGASCESVLDSLAEEVALEIRVNGKAFGITMRTPGDDFALVAGLLFAEEVVSGREDVKMMGYGTEGSDPERMNLVQVELSQSAREYVPKPRNLPISASCGVCGKSSLADLGSALTPLAKDDMAITPSVLYSLPPKLRMAQEAFQRTGGLHAAGLFSNEGELLLVKEDVGRHNAVDKAVGCKLMEGEIPLSERILLVSGRVSFEILQKAARAQIPVLCAVSAPSSLAVEMAQTVGMTLVGFLRGDGMNVYAGAERILGAG